MKTKLLDLIVCPDCKSPLLLRAAKQEGAEIMEGTLTCRNDHAYTIVNAVPRLIRSDDYVDTFSFQWNKFSKVQLDIYNGTTESETTLVEKTGFHEDEVKDKLMLDAGVGSGRFSEVVSRWGGEVVGIDLSYAVDAAYRNIGSRPNVHIIQADIFNLPFKENTFDYIFSVGVLHHTPDTEQAFKRLVPLLKPDGEIAIWVYTKYFEWLHKPSTFLRKFTTKMPKRVVYYLSTIAVPLYFAWPFSKIIFPLFQLGYHKSARWRWLDTFDWYSPKYQWKHTYAEVFKWFKESGLSDITPLEHPVSMKGRK
jgi:SAM-dependent methyltransferase